MQLFRTKFQKSFILSTKKWIKCFPEKNPVNARRKSGDITCRPLQLRTAAAIASHRQQPTAKGANGLQGCARIGGSKCLAPSSRARSAAPIRPPILALSACRRCARSSKVQQRAHTTASHARGPACAQTARPPNEKQAFSPLTKKRFISPESGRELRPWPRGRGRAET